MTKINDLSVINTLTDTNKLIVWDGATRAITAKNLADYVGQAFGPFQPLDGGLTAIAGLQFGIGDFMESTGVDTFRVRKLVVQTYADLQNIAPEGRFDGLVVYTVNRETAGDGGEGWWRFSTSSTDAANGGTILAPNLGSGRWFRQSPSESGEVNVLAFGAKGDGVTNDTAAFAAANLAAGTGTVFVPAGSYVITGTITGDFWSTGGVTIIGGTVNTIITPQDISADAATAIAAKVAAETAETNAETAETGAVAARLAAEAARDAAQLSKGIFESTAAALGNGVQGHGAITGGSGGTDGTFPLITSGGTQVVPVRGTFIVSGGAVTEINVYYPGYYSSNPTGFDFSASSGLTSASAAPTMGVNAGVGEYFSVPSTTPNELILYRVTAGPAATEVLRYSSIDPLSETLSATKMRRDLEAVSGSSVPRNGLNTWAWTSGTQSFIYEMDLSFSDIVEQTAGRPITIRWPATGTFSDTPDYQQFAGSTGIGSRVDMTLDAAAGEYYVTFTLDPTATKIRLRWAATTTAGCEAPYILYENQYVVDTTKTPGKALVDAWAQSVANTSGDIYSSIFAAVLGTPPAISSGGRVVEIAAGAISEGNIFVHGAVVSSDIVTLVLEFNSLPAGFVRNVSLTPHTGLSGGGGVSVNKSFWRGNYYIVQSSCAAAGGADPRYIAFRIDNRDVSSPTQTAQTLKVSVRGLFKGAIDPKKFEDVDAVERYLSIRKNRIAYVSSVNPTGQKDIYPTLQDAYVAGHTNIVIDSETYRLPNGLAINRNLSLRSSGKSGSKPVICTSENVPAASWAQTGADPSVYYYATSIDPGGLWEISATGVISRMGVDSVVPGRRDESASEAAVQSAADGAWWYGTGTEGAGVYMKPYGGSISGKSYELPRYFTTLNIYQAKVALQSVSVLWGSSSSCNATQAQITTENCVIGRSGEDNGVNVGFGTTWIDYFGDYVDAGDDGVDSNGSCTFVTYGGTFRECRGDGLAPHGNGNTIAAYNARMTGNYKQGFVTIGTGDFVLSNCLLTQNYDVDLLVSLGSATLPSTIDFMNCVADSTVVDINTTTLLTGRIRNHAGSIRSKANISIENHVCVGSSGPALDVDGGTISVINCDYRSNAIGVDLSSGVLTIYDGQILRGSTGITKSGGTINLDGARPINVPDTGIVGAPTTRSSGLSAGEISLLASVAAV